MFTKRYDHSFFINKSLKKRQPTGRCSHYVMVPGCPRFPTLHPGVDDTIDCNKDMLLDYKDLIEMGEATIQTLLKSGEKTCERVIFFSANEDNPIYAPHLLSSYIDKILRERQYKFVLHIAGHGNPEKIGPIDPDARIIIEDFADMLTLLLQDIDPNTPIYIVFHTCNSAYANIHSGMQPEEIRQAIRSETLIGKFARAMNENGFNNISVTGYRGYYSHLKSHMGSVVTDDFANPQVTLVAENTAVTIHTNGNVILPDNPKYLFFGVSMVGIPIENSYRPR